MLMAHTFIEGIEGNLKKKKSKEKKGINVSENIKWINSTIVKWILQNLWL